MAKLLYLEVNAIGITILAILLGSQRRSTGITREQRMFNSLCMAVIVTIALDSAMWLVDGERFYAARTINWLVTCGYYFFNCYVPYLWLQYMAMFFDCYETAIRRKRLIVLAPLVIDVVLLCINPICSLVYRIDAANVYSRGPLMAVMMAFAFAYILAALFIAYNGYLKAENDRRRNDCLLMIWIIILPTIATVLQMMFYGMVLIWISTALGILLIYIKFQNWQISRDELTGLNNRYQFNRHMQGLIGRDAAGENCEVEYAMIMLDVDSFKSFNDTYGHVTGDKALITVADILNRSCRGTNAFTARYGGDEFAVVCDERLTDEIMANIELNTREANAMGLTPIPIHASVGSVRFKGGRGGSIDEIITAADAEMYKHKPCGAR